MLAIIMDKFKFMSVGEKGWNGRAGKTGELGESWEQLGTNTKCSAMPNTYMLSRPNVWQMCGKTKCMAMAIGQHKGN